MTLTPLFKLREWLTVDEAAQHLSTLMDEVVSEADVLRLALDGKLKLSVYLPESTRAVCWAIPEEEDAPVDYWVDSVRPEITEPKFIGGIWDLPLIPPASQLLEGQYNAQRGLPPIYVNGPAVLVERRETVELPMHCRLHIGEKVSSADSVFPAGTVVVVRTAAIRELISVLSEATTSTQGDKIDTRLTSKERATLLVIIAALATKVGIDVAKHSTAGKIIEGLTIGLGARVSGRTVEEHFKLIPDAIERRGKLD